MQMPKDLKGLFVLKGEMGRWEYFKSSVYRNFLAFVVLLLVVIFDLIFDMPNYQSGGNVEGVFQLMMTHNHLYVISALAFSLPIAIRRIRDIGIGFWWLFVFEVLYLLPEPMQLDDGGMHMGGRVYLFLITIPYILFRLYLVLWPGKTFRTFRKSAKNSSQRGSQKVTFSE